MIRNFIYKNVNLKDFIEHFLLFSLAIGSTMMTIDIHHMILQY